MSWKVVNLGEVATINPSRQKVNLADSDDVTFVPMEAVDELTGTIATARTSSYGDRKKGYTTFANDDVIFAKITPCMQNGKHAVAKNMLNGVGFGSTEFHVIRAHPAILPDWIHFFLRKKETIDAAVKTFTGTVGQQRVPADFLQELEVPLPCVAEQRRIADRLKTQLATVEIARNAAKAQLAEVGLLNTRALDCVFRRIKGTSPIGDVARIQSGYAFKSQAFQTAGVRLLRNANISPGKVHWDKAVFLSPDAAKTVSPYLLVEADVLISLDRPIISSGIKVARIITSDLPSLLVQRVGRFKVDNARLNPDFLYAFLQTRLFIDAISGHDQSLGVPHISPSQIEAIHIPLPNLDEQKRLAKLLNRISESTREARSALESQLREIELLPSRLLAQAFDGKP